jgi:Bacteriophage HK97-gp10, putative tail-component
MPATLRIDGLDDELDALTALPTTLRDQAAPLVRATADQAEATIRAAYPVVSGQLRDSLHQETVETPAGIKVRLINDAPEAIWYEYGTVFRHTSLGYARGRMPAAKVFVPEVMRDRRALIDDLIPVVEAEGLKVRGQ